MNPSEYEVILTNGEVEHKYLTHGFNQKEAIILAQAEAIKAARSYEVVSVKKIERENRRF